MGLLITLREQLWDRDKDPATGTYSELLDKNRVFATELPLAEALAGVLVYQNEYRKRYPKMLLKFTFVSFSQVEADAFEILEEFGVEFIEDLEVV